ncbi:HAD family hydrolase [Myceligenerans pegani]|uniref:HAD family hydrolase n=1 Tax=Myceligenerans pegani TaxID=2776917 RepID=A0ABR9MV17_9MICO|nr:HAD-IIIA family hydrolase [Myceligenerans sp. TRM 65318]MBE1875233.1 HAD family hydrolase [Myceligenerans sp. TRM 65318]MBE3017504.1 HAD family hydrolase [Myceligenerans sp. TRM 65318]
MPEASKIVKAASAILLDFDGPVTRLMPPSVAATAADAARRGLFNAAVPIPRSLEKSKDHLEVLRHAGTLDRIAIRMTDDACIEAEAAAAARSEPTPGVREMLKAAARRGQDVVIISNNAPEAIEVFLNRTDLAGYVELVIGRPPRRPDLMKPNPFMVRGALTRVGIPAEDAVVVGDSATDMQAARAAGVPAVGFARTPGKVKTLFEAGADDVTEDMADLA